MMDCKLDFCRLMIEIERVFHFVAVKVVVFRLVDGNLSNFFVLNLVMEIKMVKKGGENIALCF